MEYRRGVFVELSVNFGDGLGRSGGGGYGLGVSRFSDDLDPVVECHTENEFWQLVVAIETTPALLGSLKQFALSCWTGNPSIESCDGAP